MGKGRETSSKKRERNERRLGERSSGPFVKREESPSTPAKVIIHPLGWFFALVEIWERDEKRAEKKRESNERRLGESSSGPFVKREESPSTPAK